MTVALDKLSPYRIHNCDLPDMVLLHSGLRRKAATWKPKYCLKCGESPKLSIILDADCWRSLGGGAQRPKRQINMPLIGLNGKLAHGCALSPIFSTRLNRTPRPLLLPEPRRYGCILLLSLSVSRLDPVASGWLHSNLSSFGESNGSRL